MSLIFLGCAEEPEPGTSCFESDECEDMSCYCVRGDGEIPGVCNHTSNCSSDADCEPYGEGLSCVEDFCDGINVCLRQGHQ